MQDSLFSNIRNNFPAFFEKQKSRLYSFFKELVEINTYSYNEGGISRCLDIFSKEVPNSLYTKTVGQNLILSNSSSNYILLMGHIDTVFPQELGFNHFLENKDKIYGPGVFDMKGGLIVALFSLIYLEHLGILKDIPIVFIINSDEEIGSINSKDIIIEYAKQAAFALVFEGAGPNGEVVGGRKGKIGVRLEAKGEAGHAAFVSKNKPSAILEMAHKVIHIENLNNSIPGLSANAGKINGGIGPNTIPDYCELMADFRYSKQSHERLIVDKLKKICEKNITGTNTKFKITSSRPCMEIEKNLSLYKVIQESANYIGYDLGCDIRPGVSDANFISMTNTPVIDGMGPIGGRDHSKDEYIVRSSIKDRILLTSISIINGFKKYIEKDVSNN